MKQANKQVWDRIWNLVYNQVRNQVCYPAYSQVWNHITQSAQSAQIDNVVVNQVEKQARRKS